MKTLLISAWLSFAAVVSLRAEDGVVIIHTSSNESYLRYSNTVAGAWAAGNAFNAGLYWAADQITLERGGGDLVLPLANFHTNSSLVGFLSFQTVGPNRHIPSRGGLFTYFQLRAWSAGYDSWEAALASGDPNVLVTGLTGPGTPPIVGELPWCCGWGAQTPFLRWAPGTSLTNPLVVEIGPIPEPSTIALLVLGLLGVGLLRRRT